MAKWIEIWAFGTEKEESKESNQNLQIFAKTKDSYFYMPIPIFTDEYILQRAKYWLENLVIYFNVASV